jgi:outer membrane usher protein
MKNYHAGITILTFFCYTTTLFKTSHAEPLQVDDSVNQSSQSGSSSTDEEKANFFLKAFGKEIPSTYLPHEMQVILDQHVSKKLIVDINPYTQSIRFRKTTMVPFLEEHLLQVPLREILQYRLNENFSDDYLRQQGFDVKTDMKRQMIFLTSPLTVRNTTEIYLRSQPRITTLLGEQARPISGYINMSSTIQSGQSQNNYGSHYNVNVNVQDWLFQSEMLYDNSLPSNNWSLIGVSSVKDWYQEGFRLTIGDNGSPNTNLSLEKPPLAYGFQQKLFGINTTHSRQLKSITNTRTNFTYMLVVEEEARIEIEINGNIAFQQIMNPGKYKLRDFPFQLGRNDIIFRQITRTGIQKEYQLEYLYNPSMLSQGQTEVQVTSGIPYKNSVEGNYLDYQHYTNLIYWRYGLSDQIGTTAYLQTVNGNFIFGGIGEYGFGTNILSIELAHSKNEQQNTGQTVRVQAYSSNVNYFIQGSTILPNYYTLNIDYSTPSFSQDLIQTQTETSNNLRSLVAPSLIWQFTGCCQLQVSALLRDYHDLTEKTKALEIRSYYRTKQWQFDYTFEKSSALSADSFIFFINATWWPKGKQYNRLNYRYNDKNKMHQVSANMSPENQKFMNYQWNNTYIDPNNHSYSANLRYQSIGQTISTGVLRSTNNSLHNDELMVDYDGARSLVDIRLVRSANARPITTLKIDTAIAFVGKHWGISRPINESFAILFPNNKGIKEGKIRFKDGSVLDKYSSAVYPTLANYQSYEIDILSADVPIGLDLGAQHYTLSGTLNSGQAIPIGKSGGTIMASAILLKPNGKPFDLEVGTFIFENDPTLQVQFFTNRMGKLFVQGLKSGDYKVEILGSQYANFTVSIPEEVTSPYQLGIITLEIEEREN